MRKKKTPPPDLLPDPAWKEWLRQGLLSPQTAIYLQAAAQRRQARQDVQKTAPQRRRKSRQGDKP